MAKQPKRKNRGGTGVVVAAGLGVAMAVSQQHPGHGRHHGLTAVLDSIASAPSSSGGHHHRKHRAAVAPPGAVSTGSNVDLGRSMAARRGWTGSQWSCLDWLWTRESGWSNLADNRTSGAYGIAQALGHGPTNQYPAGPANPPQSSASAQIRWGLGYIAGTYQTPCGAWSHEESAGWY